MPPRFSIIKTATGYVKDWRVGRITPQRRFAERFATEEEAKRIRDSLFSAATVLSGVW